MVAPRCALKQADEAMTPRLAGEGHVRSTDCPVSPRKAVVASIVVASTCIWSAPQSLAAPSRCAGPFVAAAPGSLPLAGAPEVAGVALPTGRPLTERVLWVTDAPVNDRAGQLWADLAERFADTGLWPVFLASPLPFVEWLTPTTQSEHTEVPDGEAVLRRGWSELVEMFADDPPIPLEPFSSEFPGLAAAQSHCAYDALAIVAEELVGGHLGLVAVRRPADVPVALGWTGGTMLTEEPADVASVLRSWEDRFGAYLYSIGHEDAWLVVERPPKSGDDLARFWAEQLAFNHWPLMWDDWTSLVETPVGPLLYLSWD